MIEAILFIFFIQNIIIGALLGRIDGGGVAKVPEWVERSLIMAYFVLACVPFAGWYAALAFAGVAGIATGHGQYFFSRLLIAQKPEFFDFVVRAVFGQDWRTQFPKVHTFNDVEIATYHEDIKPRLYWRCAFGMFVTGTVLGLPAAALALVYGQFWAAALFLMTGIVKALAYMAGDYFHNATEPAEWYNGAGRTAICLIILLCLSVNF